MNVKSTHTKLLPLFFILLFGACEKENMDDCFKGTGDRKQVTREVKPFYGITLHDHIELSIVEDSIYKITVSAGENLLPLIRTEMEGDTLVIRNDNTCNWMRSYDHTIRVKVHTPELNKLEYRGSANVRTINTLHTDSFHYAQWSGGGDVALSLDVDKLATKLHTGQGNLECSGRCETAYVFNNGTGFMRMQELEAGTMFVSNSGTGNVHVHVKEALGAAIDQLGNIYYRGDPHILYRSITGKGELIEVDG